MQQTRCRTVRPQPHGSHGSANRLRTLPIPLTPMRAAAARRCQRCRAPSGERIHAGRRLARGRSTHRYLRARAITAAPLRLRDVATRHPCLLLVHQAHLASVVVLQIRKRPGSGDRFQGMASTPTTSMLSCGPEPRRTIAACGRPWCSPSRSTFLSLRETAEAATDPEALPALAEARQVVANGDLVHAVDAVRSLVRGIRHEYERAA